MAHSAVWDAVASSSYAVVLCSLSQPASIPEQLFDGVRLAQQPRGRLSRTALAALTDAVRLSAELSTPAVLTDLLVQLVCADGRTIFDPAAGECGLLLLSALWQSSDDQPPALAGVEINEEVWRIGRSRCYLYELPADIRLGNALTMD